MLGSSEAPLRLNGEKYSKTFETYPGLGAGKVDYYSGESADPGVAEAQELDWLSARRKSACNQAR